jgi:hypothetical protein
MVATGRLSNSAGRNADEQHNLIGGGPNPSDLPRKSFCVADTYTIDSAYDHIQTCR